MYLYTDSSDGIQRYSSISSTGRVTKSFKMSVDFGPIPMPQSPIQDYFERKYKSSSANATPPTPHVHSPRSEHSIENQLAKALADLAKKQSADNTTSIHQDDGSASRPETSGSAAAQRRDSSATSTGYTKLISPGHLKRRSLSGSIISSQASSRRPSR